MLKCVLAQSCRWKARSRLLFAALAAMAFFISAPVGEATEVAVIGNATLLRPLAGARFQGEPRELAVGADLHRDEQVWTADGARLDIKFADGSSVTLGENARMVLDEFVLPES